MSRPIVIVLCNALEDATREQRGITSDSPAASRKVFLLCEALRLAGVRPYVVSLGRGRANGTRAFFRGRALRVRGVPVIYAPFTHVRGLSELSSLAGPLPAIRRLSRHRVKAVVYYNRLPAYAPALIAARVLGYRNVLDLEDGELAQGVVPRALRWLYDRLCRGGALLACSALERATRARPTLCYYGTAPEREPVARWSRPEVSVLMAGTLAPDTGADLLLAAIRALRTSAPAWASGLVLHVTGKGPSLAAFQALAAEPAAPRVVVHGRTSDAGYAEILDGCEIGLALKPVGGPLADTTFPSKVVEFAAAGLLVLTTDISDVRQVLGPSAIYLERNDPADLISLLRVAVEDRRRAQAAAEAGRRAILERCSPEPAGRAVAEFLFGEAP